MNRLRWAVAIGAAWSAVAHAQQPPPMMQDGAQVAPFSYLGGAPPVMDNAIYGHALLDQFEARLGDGGQFRYDGQAWLGTDENKLWVKSEGLVTQYGQFTDGQHEVLADHAITSYFDVQAGLRSDLDNGTTRTWAALGIQGLAAYFFDLEATLYASDQGHYAARLVGSYDLAITNRLFLQPEAELNFYTRSDPTRGVGPGLATIDSGLRLRYELSRKFAPYIGVSYQGAYGETAQFTRLSGLNPNDVRFVFGIRCWY